MSHYFQPHAAARQASLSSTTSQSFISIESVMLSNHLILCHPILLLPSIFPSIRVFSNESTLPIKWSISFSIGPFIESSGLISFRIDWLDLIAVQGTHKSLIQHHSSKASLFQCSAFFIVQLLHPYTTTGKTSSVSQSVQLLSRVWLFVTPWTAAHQTSLSIINSLSLFKLTSIELVIPSNDLILSFDYMDLCQLSDVSAF